MILSAFQKCILTWAPKMSHTLQSTSAKKYTQAVGFTRIPDDVISSEVCVSSDTLCNVSWWRQPKACCIFGNFEILLFGRTNRQLWFDSSFQAAFGMIINGFSCGIDCNGVGKFGLRDKVLIHGPTVIRKAKSKMKSQKKKKSRYCDVQFAAIHHCIF